MTREERRQVRDEDLADRRDRGLRGRRPAQKPKDRK